MYLENLTCKLLPKGASEKTWKLCFVNNYCWSKPSVCCTLWTFIREKCAEPTSNWTQRAEVEEEVFLVLFSHLRGCFRTSPALSQYFKGWHTAGRGEDALPEFRLCKCWVKPRAQQGFSEQWEVPKPQILPSPAPFLLPLWWVCCAGFPPHTHACLSTGGSRGRCTCRQRSGMENAPSKSICGFTCLPKSLFHPDCMGGEAHYGFSLLSWAAVLQPVFLLHNNSAFTTFRAWIKPSL